ncbi:restriction endonuclease subunit S [Marinobacter halophilus]|uniref:Restriction endonuclease subunit S n=1 Tax=Marinobacter halophilus TaxID=1323740 RepID=A0A2T1KC02_9GAMM|nr:restriction endonuclease subunit S [Marinobacter halophilus]PSF07646.1 restriction endonuclease subunit S [Marinobacter halophilus]GGC56037.1 type I restriction endonuclease EcoAI subunit S [Marinobacter halophilus]
MSAQELITEHLDLWTGAVSKKSSSGRGSNGKVELTGVKKLRELILELAVRGKLVEQDPAEEPARALLERVRAEKLRLVKQGEIKKPRKLPGLSELTIPFPLPENWEWAQLEDVGRDWSQKTPSSDFSYIDVASVDNLRGVTTQASILSADEAPSRARKVVHRGTLIYSTVRPYLQNIAVVEREIEPEPIASTAFAILYPLSGMPARFFLHYLRSPVFVKYVESVQTGIAYPAINDKQFFSGVVPIPPLEEQHRIVQKVDELMALCDRLEQQTSDQLEAHKTLVDTLLGTLTQSENATELADNWARLAAHFDTLFTTEQSIDKLKQAILRLAFMGLLSSPSRPDPCEAVILDEATSYRSKSGNTAGEHSRLSRFNEDEVPFDIPERWQWVKLGQLFEITSSKRVHARDYVSAGVPFYRSKEIGELQAGRSISTDLFISKERYEELSKQSGFPTEGDLMLTSVGTIGNTWIADGRAFYYKDGNITKISKTPRFEMRLLQHFIKSPVFRQAATSTVSGTAYNALTIVKLKNIPVPLIPLREQELILKKVDELMVLCDQLKERLNQASATRCQLAEAIVEQGLSA